MKTKHVTVKAVLRSGDKWQYTLWLNHHNATVTQLGSPPHGTQIIVDQELVDALQEQVNQINQIKASKGE